MTQIDNYRRLRGLSEDIHDGALALVQHASLIEFGRRLGAVRMGELALDDDLETKLVYDLAIHTARPGRSRAIDRYARTNPFPPDSDEARVLAALQQAQFTLFKIAAPHATAGVIANDLLRNQSFHMMDVSMGLSAEPGQCFAGRLAEIDGFRMSVLVVVPATRELLETAMPRFPAIGQRGWAEAFQDPRVAVATYRSAMELGYLRNTLTFDVVREVPTKGQIAAVIDHQREDWRELTAAD